MPNLFANLDWVKAGKTLGVPALVAIMLLVIVYQFNTNQSEQLSKDAAAREKLLEKESETRQTLMSKLVDAQIEQGRMTSTTLVRMGDSVKNMEQISKQSTENDRTVIGNQGKIIDAIADLRKISEQSTANSKAIVEVQTKVGNAIERMAPTPKGPGG